MKLRGLSVLGTATLILTLTGVVGTGALAQNSGPEVTTEQTSSTTESSVSESDTGEYTEQTDEGSSETDTEESGESQTSESQSSSDEASNPADVTEAPDGESQSGTETGTKKTRVVITFETGPGDPIDPMEAQWNTLVSFPSATGDGLYFAGWFLDAKLTKPLPRPYRVVQDVTLYAKWSHKPVRPVYRAGGDNRYTTALRVSYFHFEGPVKAVFLASGATYPDALAASAIAGQHDSPVLLAPPGKIPHDVAQTIKQLKPENLFLVGGSGALDKNVERQAKALVGANKVKRLGGADRFETAAMVSTQGLGAKANSTVYLANGMGFPDALTASAAAALEEGSVLLVTPQELPAPTKAKLAQLKPKNIVITGGQAVVSEQVAKAASQAAGGAKVHRLGGANRFETAKVVAQNKFKPAQTKFAVVANGMNYPDALVGSAVAGTNGGPVLLVMQKQLPNETADTLRVLRPDQAMITGGEGVVNSQVEREVSRMLR